MRRRAREANGSGACSPRFRALRPILGALLLVLTLLGPASLAGAVGSSLAGRVLAGTTPQVGVRVWVYTATTRSLVGTAVTGTDGSWRVGSLAAGSYKVQVSSGATTSAVPTWYPSASGFDSASPVALTAGAPVTGLDVVIVDALLTGRVYDAAGNLNGIQVTATRLNGATTTTVRTAANGRFEIRVAAPASYWVTYNDASLVHPGVLWWDSAIDADDATPVAVTAGAVRGLDQQLYTPAGHPLPPFVGTSPGPRIAVLGDSVTGLSARQLRDALGTLGQASILGLRGARIDQMQPVADRYAALAPDVAVVALGFNDAYYKYPLAQSQVAMTTMLDSLGGAACTVLVIPGEWVGRNTLPEAQAVAAALRTIAVDRPGVVVADWNRLLAGHLAAGEPGGPWTVDGVHPSTSGQLVFAELIRQAVAGCDDAPASLSGSVIDDADADGIADAGEAGLAGAIVHLTGTDALWTPVDRSVVTDSNGTFSLNGLRAGTYRLGYEPGAGRVQPVVGVGTAGGSVEPDGVAGIALSPGQDASGYTFLSASGGSSLAGATVADLDLDGTHSAADVPLAGLRVTVSGPGPGGGTVTYQTTTAADGTWTVGGLAPGPHEVRFQQLHDTDLVDPLAGSFGGAVLSSDTIEVDVPSGLDGTGYDSLQRPRAVLTLGPLVVDGVVTPTAVVADPTGRVAVAGSFTGTMALPAAAPAVTLTSAGDRDGFALLLAADGSPLSGVRLGGTGPDEAVDVAFTPSGDLALAATTDKVGTLGSGPAALAVPAARSAVVAVVGADGRPSWVRSVASSLPGSSPDAAATGVATDGLGGVEATVAFTGTATLDTGESLGGAGGSREGLVARFDASGSLDWWQGLRSAAIGVATDVDVAGSTVAISGAHLGLTVDGLPPVPAPVVPTGFVAAFGLDGAPGMVRSLDGPGSSLLLGVAVDPTSGRIVVSGAGQGAVGSGGTVLDSGGRPASVLATFEPDGSPVWYRALRSEAGAAGFRVAVANGRIEQGGMLTGAPDLGGELLPVVGRSEAFAATWSVGGELDHVRLVAGAGDEAAVGAAPLPGGGAVVAGRFALSATVTPGPSPTPLTGSGFSAMFVVAFGA